jgi:hypothetical protein
MDYTESLPPPLLNTNAMTKNQPTTFIKNPTKKDKIGRTNINTSLRKVPKEMAIK